MTFLNRIVRNENGSGFAMVLIAMSVGFLLVTGLVTLSMAENTQSLYQVEETKAYYLARAGAESMVAQMKRMIPEEIEYINSRLDTGNTVTAVASAANGGGGDVLAESGEVEVTISRPSGGGTGDYLITSVANANGHQESVDIWMVYTVDTFPEAEYAAYAIDIMGRGDDMTDDTGLDTLEGSIGAGNTLNVTSARTLVGSQNFEDHTSVNPDYRETVLTTDLAAIEAILPTDNSSDPIINSVKMNGNINRDITIDTGTAGDSASAEFVREDDIAAKTFTMTKKIEDRAGYKPWTIVYMDSIKLKNGDNIEVDGDNNLMIVIEDELVLRGNIIINDTFTGVVKNYVYESDGNKDDDYDFTFAGGNTKVSGSEPDVMDIIMQDAASMSLVTNVDLYARIYAPDGKVKVKNGNSDLYGSIYANEVELGNNVSIIDKSSSDVIWNTTIRESFELSHWSE